MKTISYLYELLIRFGPDGLRGAHAIDMIRVTEGKTVLTENELPARAVSVEEFAELLGEGNAKCLETATTAMAGRDAAVSERRAMAELLAEAVDARENADRNAATLAEHLSGAKAQIAGLEGHVTLLGGELAKANAALEAAMAADQTAAETPATPSPTE